MEAEGATGCQLIHDGRGHGDVADQPVQHV